MKSRTKAVAVTVAVGGLLALSAPAFAATQGDTPDPTSLTFSVANPITAALSLSQQNVNLIASGIGANIDAASAAPSIATSTNGGKGVTGGVTVSVLSSAPDGYVLDLNGSAGGLVPSGGGAAISWFDLNIVSDQVLAGANGGSFHTTDNHFTSSPTSDPTTDGVAVISATGPSGSITNGRDNSGNNVTATDPSTGEVPDVLNTAFYVQPKSGMVAGRNYGAVASFTYIANP